jgi:hypothetical protein
LKQTAFLFVLFLRIFHVTIPLPSSSILSSASLPLTSLSASFRSIQTARPNQYFFFFSFSFLSHASKQCYCGRFSWLWWLCYAIKSRHKKTEASNNSQQKEKETLESKITHTSIPSLHTEFRKNFSLETEKIKLA